MRRGLLGNDTIAYANNRYKAKIFKEGKPSKFELIVGNANRIFGRVHAIDRFGLFLGSEMNQDKLERMPGLALQHFTSTEMRELSEILTQLADCIDKKGLYKD